MVVVVAAELVLSAEDCEIVVSCVLSGLDCLRSSEIVLSFVSDVSVDVVGTSSGVWSAVMPVYKSTIFTGGSDGFTNTKSEEIARMQNTADILIPA